MASRFWSSIWFGSEGSAATESARSCITVAAATAGAPSEGACASGVRIEPPALVTRVLNQTVSPSYWAPWISTRCGLPSRASSCARASISAQVPGGVGTKSSRYQSSWVLELYGTAYSRPRQVAVRTAASRVSAVPCSRIAPVHSRIQPASANSAGQVTSRPRMATSASCAAIRRTSCWRWPSAPRGSCCSGSVAPAGLLPAAVGGLLEGPGVVREVVPVQRDRAALPAAPAAHQGGRDHGQPGDGARPPRAKAGDPRHRSPVVGADRPRRP